MQVQEFLQNGLAFNRGHNNKVAAPLFAYFAKGGYDAACSTAFDFPENLIAQSASRLFKGWANVGGIVLEFSSDTEMGRVSNLANELFEHVLYDEEPLFISDEATLWGISMSDVNEVLERFRKYYGVPISSEETQQLPLWKLLRLVDERRKALANMAKK